MLDFVKNAFRNGISIILWVNLILSAIIGTVLASFLGSGYALLGLIIGSICGLLTNILGGGFITTILSIEKNIEEQTAFLKKHLGINTFPPDKHNEAKDTINETTVNDKWLCANCGMINDIFVPVCKKCGEEMNNET